MVKFWVISFTIQTTILFKINSFHLYAPLKILMLLLPMFNKKLFIKEEGGLK